MDEKIVVTIGEYIVELTPPRNSKHVNNIDFYTKDHIFLWNIGELLRKRAEDRKTAYYDDQYDNIRALENQNIYCYGNINCCEIDLKRGEIVRIYNNR